MRLQSPRIAPLDEAQVTEKQRRILAKLIWPGEPVPNIFLMIGRTPEALEPFLTWAGYVLSRRNSLSPRHRGEAR
jgi:hypothetical protein